MLQVKVFGMQQLKARFSYVGAAITQGTNEAIAETAIRIRNDAVQLVPVDTGLLRSSIGINIDAYNMWATVGTNVMYAPYIEFGTFKMAAQPFLRPAAQGNKAVLKALTRRALTQALKNQLRIKGSKFEIPVGEMLLAAGTEPEELEFGTQFNTL